MLGIVVSRADEASVHIGERLREHADWTAHEDADRPDAEGGGTVYRTADVELRTFDTLHIELEGAADAFGDLDLLVFASRHSGETGPLLTAHSTGNVGPAEYGGEPDQLAMAAPGALKAAVDAFDTYAPDGYDVGLECTHHGPTDVDVPSLFLEVGSAEAQWRDPAAAGAAAETVLAIRGVEPLVDRAFVGFGGGHYAPRFTRIARETDWAVGHIAADWGLEATGEPDPELVRQVFERSEARFAVLDGDRPALAALIEDLGYRIVGESWLRETDGVALELVTRAEAALEPVDAGLRFGAPAREAGPDDPLQLVDPDPAWLGDLNGVDVQRVRSVVSDAAVAFETVESGQRVAGRLAVRDGEAWDRIESSFVAILGDRFEDVRVTPTEIVVTERAFDPDRARALGVEPGPAFGRLASGEPVQIDSEEIDPKAVHETRERRYPRPEPTPV